MNEVSRAMERQELRAIHLPRSAPRLRVFRCGSRERNDRLPTLLVVDGSDRRQRTGRNARLLFDLAPRRLLGVFSRIQEPLGNAVRSALIVRARRMHEEHLESAFPMAIEESSGRNRAGHAIQVCLIRCGAARAASIAGQMCETHCPLTQSTVAVKLGLRDVDST